MQAASVKLRWSAASVSLSILDGVNRYPIRRSAGFFEKEKLLEKTLYAFGSLTGSVYPFSVRVGTMPRLLGVGFEADIVKGMSMLVSEAW